MYVAGLRSHCGKKSAEARVTGGGCVPLGSFTDRKQAGSVPTFLQQMFDRENIFTAGEGREGKYMFFYDTSHWRW